MAMALLLPGGRLGGLRGSAGGAGGSAEGAYAPPIVRDGLSWGLETGETDDHLLPRCLSLVGHGSLPGWGLGGFVGN
eukprot:COSAG03_NODE_3121_length_2201_cov_3.873930_2_plen_76_part_01